MFSGIHKLMISITCFHLQLEQRVNEVELFYLTASKRQLNGYKGSSVLKDKERHVASAKKQQQDASRREAAAAKRMQELMRQFGTILRQVTNALQVFVVIGYCFML